MKHSLFSVGIILVLAGSAVTLYSCGRPPDRVLPLGEQSVTGLLVPAELSAVRRGSHFLRQGEQECCYLESTTVNLQSYANRTVTVMGVFERNIEASDLPVLVVRSIVASSTDEPATRFRSMQFGFSFEIPSGWSEEHPSDSEVQFLLSGSLLPVLSVFSEDRSAVKTGVAIVVAGRPAVRTMNDATGEESVSLLRQEGAVTLLFTPRNHTQMDLLKSQWLTLLRSISFFADSSSSSFSSPSSVSSVQSGTGSVVFCGGPAGILCPTGFFCDISNLQENIGKCRRMK
ncbi:MAG: hypothetical protein V1926_04765 [Candidatus Peregrinibacteria bacterium]